MWNDEEAEEGVRTTYQYMTNLYDKTDSACQLAKENLKEAKRRQAQYYKRKTKHHQFTMR